MFGFLECITSKDMEKYMHVLQPKATKKKPLSFERLNMVVMPLIQYLESEKTKNELAKTVQSVNTWLDFVQAHPNLNLNTQFES